MTLRILLHLLFHFISILYQTNAFSMKMYPIDSPHLKILPENSTNEERHQFLLNISLARASNFNKKNAKLGPNSIDYPLSHLKSSYFLAQLNFGTHDPPFTTYVIIDTSSDHTWIQCAKCDPCFNLDGSIYAENSTTYAKLTLDDDRCDPKINYEGVCGFEAYFGNAHTVGYIGTDTFNFDNTAGNRIYFPNIAFGCGIHNNGFDWGDGSGKIAGVHGLSLGPRSFLTQLSYEINGRFSYCFPPDPKDATITFGDAAKISGDVETIAMNPDARYHLYLAAISVDGARLPIPSSIFELDDKNFKTGFFMDPSTPITMLNTVAYTALTGVVIAHFSAYEWIPIPFTTSHTTDLCYVEDPVPELLQFYPTIAFHFTKSPGGGGGEATLKFDTHSAFRSRSPFGFCLRFGVTSGPSIFGAYQQSNHRFLFDINSRQLSFSPLKC